MNEGPIKVFVCSGCVHIDYEHSCYYCVHPSIMISHKRDNSMLREDLVTPMWCPYLKED